VLIGRQLKLSRSHPHGSHTFAQKKY